MPGNQNPSVSSSKPSSTVHSRSSSLVRSKSLRLSSKPVPESSISSLTRHGSIRVPRAPTLTSSTKPPISVLKKPALKPKPSFISSRSSEYFENGSLKSKSTVELDSRRSNGGSCLSPIKHSDGKSNSLSDSHRTPSESPTSLHSDKSHSHEANSWCTTDLVAHLKRLTEEHEKLQVEHARLRIQLLDNTHLPPVSTLRREQQHLSQSDSHLASIPENSSDGKASSEKDKCQAYDAIIQNYRSEVLKLQEDNRKLQKKYWEQVMNSELLEDETCNGASQQIVDLIDKLDIKEKELLESTGRVQELDNHLATTNLELQQCQDALQDQQRLFEEAMNHRDELIKQLRELRAALREARETMDFLQNERSTLAETFQETELSLQMTKAEMIKEQSKSNELMDRMRKLYTKVKDKDLQVQLLRAELDRTQGNCRDMLLSQGAELTMISMHLSQMSMSVHSMLTAAADFAASELSLQKEMLEEIMADLDSEGERSESPKENVNPKSDAKIPRSLDSSQVNSFVSEKSQAAHKSLPDIFSHEATIPSQPSASVENERPTSLVQSIVRAYEQSAKSDPPKLLKQSPMKPIPDTNFDSAKTSIENLSSFNEDLSHGSSPSKESSPIGSSAFKPVGMATAFRPVRQQSLELEVPSFESSSTDEEKKTSLQAQLNQTNGLIKKVGKVIELTQIKFAAKIKVLNEEKSKLQEEVRSSKHKQYAMQTELNNETYEVEKANDRIEDLLTQLKKIESDSIQEKEALLKKNLELNEQIKCLEAVNAEQTDQIKNEVKRLIDIAYAEPNCEYLSNAQVICDKLNLKQEIAKLNAVVSHKEIVLQQLAQKFTRTTTSLDENLKKAEKEIQVLDTVIEKVFSILEENSDLVEKHDALQRILSLVSGNCDLSNISSDTNVG